jgi:ABC-2 type transport system ATP-binding protein
LTGAETLHLLGRVHGGVDCGYRDTLIERFELNPATKVRAYSKGNRQKLSLVAALMTRADLLILDEPTSGLDPLMEQVFQRCVLEAKTRGQTVLLSSHILSEVEAVCDRVAILRQGRLVETGTLAELRHLGALSVEAVLIGPVPDLSEVPGVSNVRISGNRLACQVIGSAQPALRALTDAGVERLLSREPSLEELFLAHYGADETAAASEVVTGAH